MAGPTVLLPFHAFSYTGFILSQLLDSCNRIGGDSLLCSCEAELLLRRRLNIDIVKRDAEHLRDVLVHLRDEVLHLRLLGDDRRIDIADAVALRAPARP